MVRVGMLARKSLASLVIRSLRYVSPTAEAVGGEHASALDIAAAGHDMRIRSPSRARALA